MPKHRSRELAPRSATELVQRQHSLLRRLGAELPAGKQFGARRFAHGSHLRRTFNGALHVRHVAKRCAEHLFLLRAMRTPEEAIHLDLPHGQALGKAVVAMIPIVSAADERSRYQAEDDTPLAILSRVILAGALALLLPLSTFFRHSSFLYHARQTTTFRAPGSTSSSWQCRVRTSPSTMTSTGASRLNSTRRTALRSAIGCLT